MSLQYGVNIIIMQSEKHYEMIYVYVSLRFTVYYASVTRHYKHARRSLSTVGGHTVANQPPPTTVLLSCDVLLRTTYLLYGMKS